MIPRRGPAFADRNARQSPPPYLRSPPARGANYDYPHDNPGHLTRQRLLPEGVEERFYEPDEREAAFAERLEAWRRWRERGD